MEHITGQGGIGPQTIFNVGQDGEGGPGYPNLADDAWLWGGSLDEIHEASVSATDLLREMLSLGVDTEDEGEGCLLEEALIETLRPLRRISPRTIKWDLPDPAELRDDLLYWSL